VLDKILYLIFNVAECLWDATYRLRHPIPHHWWIYYQVAWPVRCGLIAVLHRLLYHIHVETIQRRKELMDKVRNGLKHKSHLRLRGLRRLLKGVSSKSKDSARTRIEVHQQEQSPFFKLPPDIQLRIFKEVFILNAGSSNVYILTGSEFDYYHDLRRIHPEWRNAAEYTLPHRNLIHRSKIPPYGWDHNLVPQRELHFYECVMLDFTREASGKWTVDWVDSDKRNKRWNSYGGSRLKLRSKARVRKMIRGWANRLTAGCDQSLGPYLPLLLVCKRM
jgi:hypothetical protein